MSQSIKQLTKRRRYNKIATVAAEANDRLNIYKRINADTKKRMKGIQIKPLQKEDDDDIDTMMDTNGDPWLDTNGDPMPDDGTT